MMPSPWQGGRPGVKVHAWGCVSLQDLVPLLEVKYDVVTHLLLTEMLQEHHSEKTVTILGICYSALMFRVQGGSPACFGLILFNRRFLANPVVMAAKQGARGAGGPCGGGFDIR